MTNGAAEDYVSSRTKDDEHEWNWRIGRGGIITAAILVIGDEILSGRTKDKNIGYIAEYLTNIGIDLREVRIVPDVEEEIVTALNALRHRYTYVFTTGGIGPTHDDITADSVAKAFGVGIDHDPRAVAVMKARFDALGTEMNEARMRMARVPNGAELVPTRFPPRPVSGSAMSSPWPACPAIMQAMLDEVAPKLKTGAQMLSESIRADLREGDIGTELGEVAKAASRRQHRQLSVFRRHQGPEHECRHPRARRRAIGEGARRGGRHAQPGEGEARGLDGAAFADFTQSSFISEKSGSIAASRRRQFVGRYAAGIGQDFFELLRQFRVAHPDCPRRADWPDKCRAR